MLVIVCPGPGGVRSGGRRRRRRRLRVCRDATMAWLLMLLVTTAEHFYYYFLAVAFDCHSCPPMRTFCSSCPGRTASTDAGVEIRKSVASRQIQETSHHTSLNTHELK